MSRVEGPKPERAFTATVALIVSAVACAIVILTSPRPIEPSQLPALRLDRTRVAAQRSLDRALAARVPRGEDVARLIKLYRAEGVAEATRDGDFARLNARRGELAQVAHSVFTRLDADAEAALVASITERAMTALAGELVDADEARGLLGRFPDLLVRYGYADDAGLRAPEVAVRAFYKERFNLICERPRGTGLTPIEREAMEGFNALHAGGLPPEQRALAARAYMLAGGEDGAEADAIWLFQGGLRDEALTLFRRGYEHTGSLRLRNLAVYAARE